MTRRRTSQPSILSRSQTGAEHMLVVADHPAGMISISDDVMVRIMAPPAAIELVMALLHALGGRLTPPAGPISGSY